MTRSRVGCIVAVALVSSACLKKGPEGPAGPPGPAGPVGGQGAKGDQGVQGLAGSAVTVEQVGPGDAHCLYGGAKFNSNDSSSYACNGAPGASAGRLVYARSSSVQLSGESPTPFFSRYVTLAPGDSASGPSEVAAFQFNVAADTTTSIRFDGDYLDGTCSIQYQNVVHGSLSLRIFDHTTGNDVGVAGHLICTRNSGESTPCIEGFIFTALIPAGRLAVGTYDAKVYLGPGTCNTVTYPGGPAYSGDASWQIGKAALLVEQFSGT